MQRPWMRFVPTKSVEQLDLQALHRVRARLVRHRTSVINQIRALLLEHGIAIRLGARFLRAASPDLRTSVRSPKSSKIGCTKIPLETFQIGSGILRISGQPQRGSAISSFAFTLRIGH